MSIPLEASQGYSLETALELAALGYKLVPIPAGFKYPKGFGKWQQIATNNEYQIRSWFAETTHGIGWAMGKQPNGKFLFTIDVDGPEGMETLVALLEEHGQDGFTLNATACQQTGGGGMHFVFETTEEIANSAKQFAPHIDIRGEGGQIVVGPTIHPNGKPYQWVKDATHVRLSPEWVIETILCEDAEILEFPKPPGHRPTPPTYQVDDTSPADWIRENVGIADMLVSAGWVYMESKGSDQYWCRPGKNPKDGHSAILHGDGPLVVWSTEVPWRSGSDNRDGSLSFSPFQVWAEIHSGGNIREASSQIRKNLMPAPTTRQGHDPDSILANLPVTGAAGAGISVSEIAGVDDQPPLNLLDEFWESKPWLAHVRQAADSRLVSPDALLISVLARFAALIPPTLQLPGIIGSTATFDFIGCVVASSHGGKTIANSVAADLLPNRRTDILMDASPGSGEGLIQAFMGYDKDEKGKRIGDPSYKFGKYKAIHFTVDEGSGLMEQQGRKGTTIVQTMCSAWSGSGLGQLNASIETNRFVPAKKRRVSATMNIQTAFGYQLLADDMVNVGLPQRIVFSWAHSPMPDEAEWPGELAIRVPPSTGAIHLVEYVDEISAEIIAARRSSMTGQADPGKYSGHRNLVKLKVASIMALIEGSEIVDLTHWELASQVMNASDAVRETLLSVRAESKERDFVTQGTVQGIRELANEDYKERQKVDRLATRITLTVQDGPEEGFSWNKLRKAVCSSSTKHRFDAAVHLAQGRGGVEIYEVEGQGQAGRHVRKM